MKELGDIGHDTSIVRSFRAANILHFEQLWNTEMTFGDLEGEFGVVCRRGERVVFRERGVVEEIGSMSVDQRAAVTQIRQ